MSLRLVARRLDNFEAFIVFLKLDFRLRCLVFLDASSEDLNLFIVDHISRTFSRPAFSLEAFTLTLLIGLIIR